MIKAVFDIDERRKIASLHVNGHAGMDVEGKDIVCAAASILSYTLAQNIKMYKDRGQLKYNPTIKMNNGDANISCRAKDDETYAEILHAFLVIQTGFALLAHNYPRYVVVKMFGQAEKP